MKIRHLLMAAGLVGAAWLAIFGDRSADTGVVKPLARHSAIPPSFPAAPDDGRVMGSALPAGTTSQAAQGDEAGIRILALRPRAELIGAASNGRAGAGLFSGKSWTPPPRPARVDAPPPPPSAPPLPFTYLGMQTSGGQTQVFLASGDKVFVARDRAVIQDKYRVESIKPPVLSLNYLPLNQIQRLSIGVTN